MDQEIIMNFSVPPSLEDLSAMATGQRVNLPEELTTLCEKVVVQVEDMPDEAVESDLDIEDAFDLLAFYKGGKQISPGVESKKSNDDDVLILYRRPILDAWCETGEELSTIVRDVMIEELASNFSFTEDEVEEMIERDFQGAP